MPSKQENKSNGFVFTINNPTDQDEWDYGRAKGMCQYVTYGEEIGESGTPHWQGFIWFKDRTRSTAVRKLLPRAHVERMRGTIEQAINYCHKDGIYTEHGDRPVQEQRKRQRDEDYKSAIKKAEEGDMDGIKSEHPGIFLRYYNVLSGLQRRDGNIITGELQHEWWVGPTGTGKSREAWMKYPDHYQKELNKWWDGYKGQDTVVIEEWSPKNECTASALKIWADRYPFTGQIKGGSLQRIRPKKIIVTSNYTIDQCFPNPEDAEPMKRRFKVIKFDNYFNMQDDPEVRAWLSSLEDLANGPTIESLDRLLLEE